MGRISGIPIEGDLVKATKVEVSDFEECSNKCLEDKECLAASMEDCQSPCYLIPFSSLTQIEKTCNDTGEASIAIKLLTNEPTCERNIGNLLKSKAYEFYDSDLKYRIETTKYGWNIGYFEKVNKDLKCSWDYERVNGRECDSHCLLTMIKSYGYPIDLNGKTPLKTVNNLPLFENCTAACHSEPLCYSAYMGSMMEGCVLFTIGQVTIFQKTGSLDGHQVAIKINTNPTTCKFPRLRLANGLTSFDALPGDKTIKSYQVKDTGTGISIFAQFDGEVPKINCPLGWTHIPDDTRRFCVRYVDQKNNSLSEATRACKAAGGNFVSARDPNVLTLVNAAVQSQGGINYRLGMSREESCIKNGEYSSDTKCLSRSAYVATDEAVIQSNILKWKAGFPSSVLTDACVASDGISLINTQCDGSAGLPGFVCAIPEFFYNQTMKQCSWDNDRLNGAECRSECLKSMITMNATMRDYTMTMQQRDDITDFEDCRKTCFNSPDCYVASMREGQHCLHHKIDGMSVFEADNTSLIALKIHGDSSTCSKSTDQMMDAVYLPAPPTSNYSSYYFNTKTLLSRKFYKMTVLYKKSFNAKCPAGWSHGDYLSGTRFSYDHCVRVLPAHDSVTTRDEGQTRCMAAGRVMAGIMNKTAVDDLVVAAGRTSSSATGTLLGMTRRDHCISGWEVCTPGYNIQLIYTLHMGGVPMILNRTGITFVENNDETKECLILNSAIKPPTLRSVSCDSNLIDGYACDMKELVADPYNKYANL